MMNLKSVGYRPSLSGAHPVPAGTILPYTSQRDAFDQRRVAREAALAILG